MKRVLVTGAGGFIGANLARRCLRDGHRVTAFVRPGAGDWRLKDAPAELEVCPIDLRDREGVARAVGAARPEWIFHTAAYGAYSWQTDARLALETNVSGTLNLLDACSVNGFDAFVNSGSSSEYGPKNHPPDETDPAEPRSQYAVSKLSATEYGRFFARARDLPITTLRLYSVFGPWEDPRRLMPMLITRGLAGDFPPLAGPDLAHDFVFVDDVCEAFALVAAHGARGAVFNVGTGVQTTLAEVADVARRVLKIAAIPAWDSMAPRSGDTTVWVAKPERIARECGWRASHSLEQGFRAFAGWLETRPRMMDFYRAAQADGATAQEGG